MRISKGDIFERVFVNEPVNLCIEQEADSRVKIHVINMPSIVNDDQSSINRSIVNRQIVNSISVTHLGENCSTEIYALAFLHGTDAVTTETQVHHAVGGGTSTQLIKFVLDDNSRGRFIGDLNIAPDAQHTEAHQTNRNLLLSDTAEMRTQPQLEIYADDVKASHGASTGQLDESALFYMQQRGISKNKARQLLVNAFMQEILDKISDEEMRERLLDSINSIVQ